MQANLELSESEMRLVSSPDVILTKNRIVKKVEEIYSEVLDGYLKTVKPYGNILPAEVFSIAPRIFKGEQYHGLPYVMLDYPRLFAKQDVFAIRCFFWWGNFFSISLQLQGKYMNKFLSNIQGSLETKKPDGYYYCIGEDPWNHEFSEENLVLIDKANVPRMQNLPFIKLAKKIPLQEWDNVTNFYESSFSELISLLVD